METNSGMYVESQDLGLMLSVIHETDGVSETCEAVVEFAIKAIGCTAAVIAVDRRQDQLAPVAVSPATATGLVDGELGHDPVSESYLTASAVVINNTSADHRWPDWSDRAESLGFRSLIIQRLTLAQKPVGVLVLAHSDPGGFDRDDLAIAHIVARHASIALASAQKQESLAEAVDARKLVGQAMGILMERYSISDDQAFAILRRYSQDTNIKLREIATQLVSTRKLPEYEGSPRELERGGRRARPQVES